MAKTVKNSRLSVVLIIQSKFNHAHLLLNVFADSEIPAMVNLFRLSEACEPQVRLVSQYGSDPPATSVEQIACVEVCAILTTKNCYQGGADGNYCCAYSLDYMICLFEQGPSLVGDKKQALNRPTFV